MRPPSRFGPLITSSGVTFRLWAPRANKVSVILDAPHAMVKTGEWFERDVPGVRPGAHYQFEIDGALKIADPASRFQPDDVQGPSEVIEQAFDWKADGWKGAPWEQAIFLEAHVGTFTHEGTFRAMIDHLDHLVETGITALELMPVADFPGRWNWGYDGVLLYAPDSAYGRPEDLKALIDAAHQRGLMVFLDVVYNHFGPEGNYLGRLASSFFSEAHTPWGGAINYSVPEVRAFAIDNALYWLRDYRFDGLRLDAVHAIATPGDVHLLTEMSKAVGELAAESGRQIHLVLENDDNRASLLAPDENPPAGRYRAQWNDDYHHAWHVLLTGETAGYYGDYENAAAHVARTLAEGFAYQGEASPHRNRAARGEPSGVLPRSAFVNFLQNHDQIGNRPLGERLSTLAKPEAVHAALTVLLLQPSPPLLFMGEEWGATEPFPFFCDFTGELAQAVRDGRKREFAGAYAKYGGEIPDPIAEETRNSAVLNWQTRTMEPNAAQLSLTRRLLAVRKQWVTPLLPSLKGKGEASLHDGLLVARWAAGGGSLTIIANLSEQSLPRPSDLLWERPIWGGMPPDMLPPWSVFAAAGA